jgi:hypothetical protein
VASITVAPRAIYLDVVTMSVATMLTSMCTETGCSVAAFLLVLYHLYVLNSYNKVWPMLLIVIHTGSTKVRSCDNLAFSGYLIPAAASNGVFFNQE